MAQLGSELGSHSEEALPPAAVKYLSTKQGREAQLSQASKGHFQAPGPGPDNTLAAVFQGLVSCLLHTSTIHNNFTD